MEFIRAASVEEASQLLADDPFGSKLIAGGTALVLMMKHRLVQPDRLVSIADLDDLDGIDVDGDVLTIRGGTTITDAASHPTLRTEFTGLAAALAVVGNVRIRNAATVAGNLAEADYASDPPAILVALGARAVVQGPDGEREVPVSELITGFYTTSLADGEIITAVRVPRRPRQRSTYLKYRSRSTEDRPCVGVAGAVELSEDGNVARCSVVIGAAGPRPQHFPELTGSLVGTRPTAEVIDEVAAAHADATEAMDDQRGSAWYREQMVQVHVRRALREILEESR